MSFFEGQEWNRLECGAIVCCIQVFAKSFSLDICRFCCFWDVSVLKFGINIGLEVWYILTCIPA